MKLKELLILTLTLIGVIVAYGIYAFIITSKGVGWISSIGDENVKTKAISVEMYGYDARSYEYPCKANPAYMCGAIATSEGVGGYSYPISNKDK